MDVIATLSAGSVEYSREAAQVSIAELIEQLQEAQDEGATHIVALSGNTRGAGYVNFGRITVEDIEDL